MKKKHKVMIGIASISVLIITGVVIFQLIKDREEYEFYYRENNIETCKIIKYNTINKHKETFYQQKKYVSDIPDMYNDNNFIIGSTEVNGNLLLDLNVIFNLNPGYNTFRYIKSNQDIACAKDNQISVYHRESQEVEKVFEIGEDLDFDFQNFDISYDGNILYYVYNDTLFNYDIKKKTTNSIINNVSYFDVSTDETQIVYFNIADETLYLMDVTTGEVAKIDKETWRRDIRVPIFNEEGTAILYAKYAIEPTYVWYYIYNIDTQKSEKVLKVTQGAPDYGWY